jgi:hypothetical protein
MEAELENIEYIADQNMPVITPGMVKTENSATV